MPNEISFKLICHDLSKIRVENYFTDFGKLSSLVGETT